MVETDVFLARFGKTSDISVKQDSMTKLFQAVALPDFLQAKDLVAIKVHVGESGCSTYMDPQLIAVAVSMARNAGAIPFTTDTAVLYRSRRTNAADHIVLAGEHGFDVSGCGAPFFPADGLRGDQEVKVSIKGNHYKEVSIAAALIEATSLIVFSHVTGHLGSGVGATLKNLGMGCSTRKAKLSQHSNMKPKIKAKKCTDCGECIEWCPEGAITDPDEIAVIDQSLCIGCGQCLAVCRFDAVAYNWGVAANELQERMVEHALGVWTKKKGEIVFVNIVQAVTKDCDCLGDAGEPLFPDIGVLVSRDPVAIDQAALDLVRKETGYGLNHFAYPGISEEHQILYAESLGLGSRQYRLVEV